jgi:phage shock protein C
VEHRLYRSQHNRVLLGVCGGFGEYFQVDPVIIRIIAILLLIPGVFPAIIAYFVLAIIIPLEGSTASTPRDTIRENVSEMRDTTAGLGDQIRETFGNKERPTGATPDLHPVPPSRSPASSNRPLYILGIIIIAIGVFFLLVNIFSWFGRFLWPGLLIIAGIIIVILVARRK